MSVMATEIVTILLPHDASRASRATVGRYRHPPGIADEKFRLDPSEPTAASDDWA